MLCLCRFISYVNVCDSLVLLNLSFNYNFEASVNSKFYCIAAFSLLVPSIFQVTSKRKAIKEEMSDSPSDSDSDFDEDEDPDKIEVPGWFVGCCWFRIT